MKQLALLICVCALFSLAAQSQSIGIHAGTNISYFDGPIQQSPYLWFSDDEELSPRAGYQLGATIHHELYKFIGLSTGVNYVQRGGKYKMAGSFTLDNGDGFSEELETDLSTYSVEVPLSIRFNLKRENITYYASAGYSLAIGLNAHTESNYRFIDTWMGNVTTHTIEDYENFEYESGGRNRLEKLTLGINSAVGVQWRSIFFDLSYYHGLDDMASTRSLHIEQRSFALSLGLMIDNPKG
jgi:hypothetical protein